MRAYVRACDVDWVGAGGGGEGEEEGGSDVEAVIVCFLIEFFLGVHPIQARPSQGKKYDTSGNVILGFIYIYVSMMTFFILFFRIL